MKHDPAQHYFAEQTILGARLKWWRERQGLKIETSAHRLGVSTATWGHWETGHTFPSGEMLLNISRLTGLPLQLLFCPYLESCPLHDLAKEWVEGTPCCQCGS